MTSSYSIFIPARYGSTRLPAKVLLKINNKTVLEHAYSCALKANPKQIIVATDHHDIAAVAHKLNAKVAITPSSCPNGTARIASAILDKTNNFEFDDDDIIVNLQADEVLMPESYIQLVAHNLAINKEASIATLIKPINNLNDLLNPNIVKVVKDSNNYAKYFSRAPVPYIRDGFTQSNFEQHKFWHHIGLYAYRVSFLKQYNNMPESELERIESLEQLRALDNNFKISLSEVEDYKTCEINTQEDFEKAQTIL